MCRLLAFHARQPPPAANSEQGDGKRREQESQVRKVERRSAVQLSLEYETGDTIESEDHRQRGLASHLLGLAAAWSAEQGCDRWVIVTEATNPAGRVYRSVGFELGAANVQVYRPPS